MSSLYASSTFTQLNQTADVSAVWFTCPLSCFGPHVAASSEESWMYGNARISLGRSSLNLRPHSVGLGDLHHVTGSLRDRKCQFQAAVRMDSTEHIITFCHVIISSFGFQMWWLCFPILPLSAQSQWQEWGKFTALKMSLTSDVGHLMPPQRNRCYVIKVTLRCVCVPLCKNSAVAQLSMNHSVVRFEGRVKGQISKFPASTLSSQLKCFKLKPLAAVQYVNHLLLPWSVPSHQEIFLFSFLEWKHVVKWTSVTLQRLNPLICALSLLFPSSIQFRPTPDGSTLAARDNNLQLKKKDQDESCLL